MSAAVSFPAPPASWPVLISIDGVSLDLPAINDAERAEIERPFIIRRGRPVRISPDAFVTVTPPSPPSGPRRATRRAPARPSLKEQAILETSTRAAARDIARNTTREIDDEPSTAWSPGYLPTHTSMLVLAALDMVSLSLTPTFDYRPGLSPVGDIAKEAKRLATSHRAAGREALASRAQKIENDARRALTNASSVLEALSEERCRLAELFAEELDGYRAGEVTAQGVFDRADELFQFVLKVTGAGFVQKHTRWPAYGEPPTDPLVAELAELAAVTRAHVHVADAELAEARRAVLSVSWLRRNDRVTRKAHSYEDDQDAERRAKANDSAFMSDVLAEYLERRSDGDARAVAKLAKACAETIRRRNIEDAMNYADSCDFVDDTDD
jgi:hypothetical protein